TASLLWEAGELAARPQNKSSREHNAETPTFPLARPSRPFGGSLCWRRCLVVCQESHGLVPHHHAWWKEFPRQCWGLRGESFSSVGPASHIIGDGNETRRPRRSQLRACLSACTFRSRSRRSGPTLPPWHFR